MPVKAPFRFARINRWIHEPAWGPLVSHDVPFADGLSGRVTLRITAKTPLLAGGRRRPATETHEGAVWPFRLPDGRWALPPSTLQGMTRAILEVAAFGRLGPWVEDRRFGIRDLADTITARKHYRDHLHGTRAGWLVMRDGQPCIIECEMARLSHDELKKRTGVQFSQKSASLEEKYRGVDKWASSKGGELRFAIKPGKVHAQASPAAHGTTGSVVITGHAPKKKREFVFHNPDLRGASCSSTVSAEVPEPVWRTFEYLHCDSNRQPTHPAWAYWEPRFRNGNPVPVFWWPEPCNPKRVATFGMAFAFKAGFPLSTHDLLRNSHPDHLKDPAEAALDLPHLIFGVAAEADKGRGLKRRAWFGLGRSIDTRMLSFKKPAILSSPKPKYLGFYVRQRSAEDDRIPQGKGGEPMAAYASLDPSTTKVVARDRTAALDNLARPELAGVKLWPGSADRDGGVRIPDPPQVTGAQPPGPKVKTKLHAVPAETVFEAPLTFHNLRPVELGALLWALSFGDAKAFGAHDNGARLRHRLGMGKPFGLGEVEIEIAGLTVDEATTPEPMDLLDAFTDHMERAYPKPGVWAKSPQVRAILKAANPHENRGAELAYMNVTGPDSYVENRDKGRFLGPYVAEEHEIEKPLPPAGETETSRRHPPSGPRDQGTAAQNEAVGHGRDTPGQRYQFRKGMKVSVHGEVGRLLEDVMQTARPEDQVMVDFDGDPEPVRVKDIAIAEE